MQADSPSDPQNPSRTLLEQTLGSSLVAQMVKRLPTKWETWVRSLGWEHPLEEEYSCLENSWTEEPGGSQSM